MSPGEIWRVASQLRHDYGPRAKRIALREAVRAKWNDQPSLAQDWLAVASRTAVVATLQYNGGLRNGRSSLFALRDLSESSCFQPAGSSKGQVAPKFAANDAEPGSL
jgi:hypothetical protein